MHALAQSSSKLIQDALYAGPKIAGSLLIAPIYVVQGIYAKYYGLSLTTIASVILFVRLFDAFTDPIIGYLSDNARAQGGTRKPFVIIGAIILSIGGYFLYTPPDNVNAFYFTFWFIVFYAGFTLLEIPHLAWGGEISTDAHHKTQTYALRTWAGYLGLITFFSIPLLPHWQTTEITPDTLNFATKLSIILMLPLMYFCVTRVPNGKFITSQRDPVEKIKRHRQGLLVPLSKTVNSVFYNRPLLLFYGAFLFGGTGLGMWLGMIFIYVDSFLNMGDLFAKTYLISLIVSIPGSLIWLWISKIIGKKYAWLSVMCLAIAAFIFNGLLDPSSASYWKLLILVFTVTLCFVCTEFLSNSILSEIVDFSTWKYKTSRGSTYFSLYVFIYKATLAIGAALGLAIAGWYGFDPSTNSQDAAAITGLMLAMTWIPILLVSIALIFIACLPISSPRHAIIRRRLERLERYQIKSKDAQYKAIEAAF